LKLIGKVNPIISPRPIAMFEIAGEIVIDLQRVAKDADPRELVES